VQLDRVVESLLGDWRVEYEFSALFCATSTLLGSS
jgi:hypothetical protein